MPRNSFARRKPRRKPGRRRASTREAGRGAAAMRGIGAARFQRSRNPGRSVEGRAWGARALSARADHRGAAVESRLINRIPSRRRYADANPAGLRPLPHVGCTADTVSRAAGGGGRGPRSIKSHAVDSRGIARNSLGASSVSPPVSSGPPRIGKSDE